MLCLSLRSQLVLFEYLDKFSCFERKTGSEAFEEMKVRICLHDHCNDRCFATKIKDNQVILTHLLYQTEFLCSKMGVSQIKLRLRNLLRKLESRDESSHRRGSRPVTAGDGGVMNCVIDDIL